MEPRGRRGEHSMKAEEMFENENDRLIQDMRTKVSELKSVSLSIGEEVRTQNKELQNMETDFVSAGGLLGSTLKRLGLLSRGGHNRWMCYMIGFVLLVFLALYYLIR